MSSSSTLETLPDEIIMIILQYSGNAAMLCRTFFGLNQRFNNILVDRRMRLFIDFLYLNYNGNQNINYYYNSAFFNDASQQFLSLKTAANEKQLHACLQFLVSTYIKEKLKLSDYQFQSNMKKYEIIRLHHTPTETLKRNSELKECFDNLKSVLCSYCSYCRSVPLFDAESIIRIKRIESLIFNEGARLNCDENDSYELNFARALNQLFLVNINIFQRFQRTNQRFIMILMRMFKALIISNPMVLKNKSDTSDGSRRMPYFLLYAIYKLKYFYSELSNVPVNMYWYQATLDLFLFTLRCLGHQSIEKSLIKDILFEASNMINLSQPLTNDQIFIHTSQKEIFRIILDEYICSSSTNSDLDETFSQIVNNLINNNQLDVIRLIYNHDERVRTLFQRFWNIRKNVNIMTSNRERRQCFGELLEMKQSTTWAINSNLLFILLQKRERTLVKYLFKLSPLLVHRLDDDDNDPLLFVCLKVRGCRHRLIEFLIESGCDWQRRNSKGENFIYAIQQNRNRKLLENLIERSIIEIDPTSETIRMSMNK